MRPPFPYRRFRTNLYLVLLQRLGLQERRVLFQMGLVYCLVQELVWEPGEAGGAVVACWLYLCCWLGQEPIHPEQFEQGCGAAGCLFSPQTSTTVPQLVLISSLLYHYFRHNDQVR